MSQVGWIILEAGIKAVTIVSLLLLSAAASVYVERRLSGASYLTGPQISGLFGRQTKRYG